MDINPCQLCIAHSLRLVSPLFFSVLHTTEVLNFKVVKTISVFLYGFFVHMSISSVIPTVEIIKIFYIFFGKF